MKTKVKFFLAVIFCASIFGPATTNAQTYEEETAATKDEIAQLKGLSQAGGGSFSKTTFSASETKEFSTYLFFLFFEEFDRKLAEYEHKADLALARMRLNLSYEWPLILPVSVASSSDARSREPKIAPDATPFVHVYAGKRAEKKMQRLVKSYFNDEVEYAFTEMKSAKDEAPLVVACNPKKRQWTVWMEFEALGTDDSDLNLYNLSEGPIFGPEFESEKKKQHVMVLKQRLEKERARALRVRRNQERQARASARNADRVSRQNAVIQNSLETQKHLGKP